MTDFLIINKGDNVAVTLKDLPLGYQLKTDNLNFTLLEPIIAGHKIALQNFSVGDAVIKYGSSIGHASCPIKRGQHIHSHNLKSSLSGLLEYQFTPTPFSPPTSATIPPTIQAYKRLNGQVAIRNELWVIPTVGCVNGLAQKAIEAFKLMHDCSSIDGIYLINHSFGCSQLGDDHENTKKMLQNLTLHPHAGGVLVIGLGCENNQLSLFKEGLGSYDPERTEFLICQEVGDEHKAIICALEKLFSTMKNDQRTEQPFSCLKVALKCGGSDGFSGVTANPLMGLFSDYLTSLGGTTLLGEVPEMFGAEQLLMNRSVSVSIFKKTVEMINCFKEFFIKNGQEIYENPSPGNKAGGITTLEEKSLGCTQKSGTSPIVDVLAYGSLIKKPGLSLINTSGNDGVSISAMAAAGCHMILFSTGRGTPFGTVVPTIKMATNQHLAQLKSHWIDFDASSILTEGRVEAFLAPLINEIAEIASGKKTKNELNNFHELTIFKTGVTL